MTHPENLVDAARGLAPVDLVLENIQMVNVYTGEIYPAEIGISGETIVHIGPPGWAAAHRGPRYDGGGKFALPGLVDTHIHIESSMMSPVGFAEAVLPHGTTTVVIDPHEIGNVAGKRGVRYMLDATANLALRVFVQVPSCVPAVAGIETAGAVFEAGDVQEMLGWERVIGLAEVMDYVGVIQRTPRMSTIVAAAVQANVPISGHCPGLRGRDLSAYLVAGPASDHEGRNYDELLEKLRAGMTIEGRVSSFSEDMSVLGKLVRDLGGMPVNLALCTDDIFPEDLQKLGHMDECVRGGIRGGMTPVEAIRAGTLQGAIRHRLHNLGALAPGKLADILLAPDLHEFIPDEVFVGGRLAARGGRMLTPRAAREPHPLEIENTVHLPHPPRAEDFTLPAQAAVEQTIRVLVINPDLTRGLETHTLPVRDGSVDITAHPELCMVSILERHGRNGNHSLGLVKGLGLHSGAVASTVAHDCHNLVVVGRNAADMAAAAATLAECGGGIVYTLNGQVKKLLPLPIGGLMSQLNLDEMVAQMDELNRVLHEAGIPHRQPVVGIFALALPVIPDYGFTDMGLVDVNSQTVLPVLV